jgi:predicted MPP superfamily phosphohydrolase
MYPSWAWMHSQPTFPLRPPNALRRRGRDSALGASAFGGACLAYAGLVEPWSLRVRRIEIPIPGLPRALDGLRAVHITDTHHGPWVPRSAIEEAVRMANALGGDLVLLTGDCVHKSPRYIEPVAEILGKLTCPLVSVLGNHDWWEGADRVRRAFASRGIVSLDNRRVFLTEGRRWSEGVASGLCIAGIGDLWEDRQDWAAALGGIDPALPRILLSHNPDVAECMPCGAEWRVDLMVSGHTHGGQVRLPFLGTPVVPSRHGQKYAHGLVRGPVCPVFISSGIGLSVLPFRFGVPPEIVEITFRSGAPLPRV